MSCVSSSSSSRTSFGEQTLFALPDYFIQSDVTEGRRTSAANVSHYDHTFAYGSGSPIYQTRASNINANLDFAVSNALITDLAECIDEESDETYSYSPYRDGDKLWQIFNNSTEALPIIDSDFYEDADACVDSPVISRATTTNVADEEDIILEDLSYDNTEHLDYSDINEVFEDFEIRSQADYIPAEFEQSIHQETLLQKWIFDYQRHEWVALKFQQPPYTTEPYEPYSVPYTTERR